MARLTGGRDAGRIRSARTGADGAAVDEVDSARVASSSSYSGP